MVRGGDGNGGGSCGGMDNSLAVFSFRGSSYKAMPPNRRSHYYPSPERERGRGGGVRTAVLSPSRPYQLSPPASPPAPTSPDFDESWPSTSLSSPSDLPEEQTDQLGDSVLAKYVARFRQAQPTSRQERQSAGPTAADFWWLQPPALGCPGPSADEKARGGSLNPAIPTQTMLQRAGASRMEAGMSGAHKGHISPLEGSDTSALDLETLSLQDRAAQLLLRSEISSSNSNEVTSIPVSSEGLPSPPLTSDPGAGCYPRESAPLTRVQVPVPSVSLPEDDILSQWRLRRKMELAREMCADGPQAQSWLDNRALVTTTHGQPKPHHIYAQGPTVANQLNSLVSLSNSQPSLPAPSMDLSRSPQSPSVGPSRSPQPPSVDLSRSPSPSLWAPAETGCKRVQSGAFSPSSSGSSEPKRQNHRPRKAGNPDIKSQAPRPGPLLRGALEQVVAARLFPGPSEDSPTSPCEAPPSPAETPPPRELLDLASGLLEAAEDSDGTDFEEDGLLQVLRARRSELRSCLREVDKRLSKPTRPENLGPNRQPPGTSGSPKEISSRQIEE